MSESYESLLSAVRQLPLVQQQLLAQKLLEQDNSQAAPMPNAQAAALEAVEKTRGTLKGLDRETIIWLAEDEELCGY